jgi:A/G-specific adenine glycosylase
MDSLSPSSLKRIRNSLLSWYDQNQRDLPWRQNVTAYRTWVSEVMLQQTRVGAILDHYARFLRRFPTVQALAAAREASVLTAWSGLGYYHRARRLHQAAKEIARHRKCEFPQNAEDWQRLPGIGRYTAAAIASIAFAEPVPAVDGNVKRVLARVFAPSNGKETAWKLAEKLLDRKRPGDFNQGMMELGATICTPKAPRCPACPLTPWCKSRGANAARPQPARKHKQHYCAVVRKGKDILLVQRSAQASLMAAMWELPVLLPNQIEGSELVAKLRHSITDTDYDVLVFSVPSDNLRQFARNGRWFSRRGWERLPLTGLTRKVLRKLESDLVPG